MLRTCTAGSWKYVARRADLGTVPDATNDRVGQDRRPPKLHGRSVCHVTLISCSVRSAVLSTLITLITVSTVRISLVYRKARSLLCSCVQLIVHSDCLVYNNTKPLLQYFITATCPLHRVQTRPLSHLTSHSRDGSHLGQGPNDTPAS